MLPVQPPAMLRYLSMGDFSGKALRMSKPSGDKTTQAPAAGLSREERLAARLRENLRRRKAQARQMGSPDGESAAENLSNRESGS